MDFVYSVWNPMGNITVLASGAVPVSKRAAVSRRLMETIPGAEQVGFLTDLRLEMAGGEFCGNAAMSAAAMIADAGGLAAGGETDIPLEVSGTDEIVPVHVARETDGSGFLCTVSMPLPVTVEMFETVLHETPIQVPLVRMPGIVHFITSDAMRSREHAETLLKQLAAAIPAEAYGLIFMNEADHSIRPLLYVPAAGTMVWENACGSGSAAVAAYLAARDGDTAAVSLKQPGGKPIYARAAKGNGSFVSHGAVNIRALSITGKTYKLQ